MKCVSRVRIDRSICSSSSGSGIAARMRLAVLMRIITMECPSALRFSVYFGGRKPGVERKRWMSRKSPRAFSAYAILPDARAYSLKAMAAKVSLKT